MKKLFISTLVFCMTLVSSLFFIKVNGFEPVASTVVGESLYQPGETVETNYLDGKLVHNKYISYSSSGLEGFNAAGSGGGGLNIPDKLYPQSVNVLEIPADTSAKVVNWTYQTNYGWALATVEQIAANFEQYNPGWKVVAAINADFFDINSTKALPLTTSGVFSSNGKVYKTSSSSSTAIGFTNNGTNNTLVGNKTIEVSSIYTLRVYNSQNQLMNEFKIDNVNPTEMSAGLSLYYSYPIFGKDDLGLQTRVTVPSTLPSGGLICNYPTHCIPMDENGFYGEGQLTASGEVELNKERFGIFSSDNNVNQAILAGAYVTIQRDIVGAYADCNQIVGCGVPLVLEGKGVIHNDKNRHPRTMVGVREDGTLLFVTVDGRQPEINMYGMTYDEQGALMENLNAVEAYNLDGGGSTTMLIRDGKEFRVLNSPSDGNARRDANALLVVIPDAAIKVTDVKDNNVTLELPKLGSDVNVKDYYVKVNGETYSINDKLVVSNLLPKTEYVVEFGYKIVYDGSERTVIGDPITIKTGNTIPTLPDFTYKYENNVLTINYTFNDPDKAIGFATLFVGNKNYDLDLEQNQIVINNVSSFKAEDASVVVMYELNSSSAGSQTVKYSTPAEFVEHVDEPKGSKCSSGAYFASIVLLISLCGVVINKRK